MRRRPFLVLALASLSGCLGSDATPETTPPDGCPLDTLEAQDPPPDDLDREAAGSYVEAYEEAYIEETEIDREEYDRVTGPGTNVVEIDPVDGGYLVDVETGWAVWYPDLDALEFEVVDEPDREPVPADHEAFEGDSVLRDHLEDATERGSSILHENRKGYEDTYDRISTAAGEVDGAVIAVDDRFVRVTRTEVPGAHGDGYARARYYVAPGVLYRAEHDEDPRHRRPLEC